MNKEEAQKYINSNIPMSRLMGMNFIELTHQSVRVAMPYAPNINHQGSVFGGSIDSLFFITCWAYVQLLVEHIDPHPRILGRRGSSVFHAPIKSDFEAQVIIPDNGMVHTLLNDLRQKGKGKFKAQANVEYKGKITAEFNGEFVVLMDN